jgi:uncharacterized membrane protein
MKRISIFVGLIIIFILAFNATVFCTETTTENSQVVPIENLDDLGQITEGGQTQAELKQQFESNIKDLSSSYDKYQREGTVRAKVLKAGEVKSIYESDYYYGVYEAKFQEITIEILNGKFKGKQIDSQYILTADVLGNIKIPAIKPGDVISVGLTLNDAGTDIASAELLSLDVSVERMWWALILIILILVLLFIYTDLKKFAMLIPIIVFIDLVFLVMIPLVIKGISPILLSVIIALITIFINSTLRVGLNKKNIIASLGAVFGVIATLLLALAFGSLLKFSGNVLEASQLAENSVKRNINLYELSISLIVLASSIICSDAACKLSKKIHEEKKDKQLISRVLLDSKKMIASRLNIIAILILTFTVPKWLLLSLYKYSAYEFLNSEIILTDLVRASMLIFALIITVPLTTIIGRLLYKNEEISEINVQE